MSEYAMRQVTAKEREEYILRFAIDKAMESPLLIAPRVAYAHARGIGGSHELARKAQAMVSERRGDETPQG